MSETGDVEKLTYEQALAELDQLIARLERGDVALDDAIRAYQRGSQLAQRCADLLDRTEAAVTQLVVGPQGTPQERPFSPAALEETPAGPAGRRTPRPAAPPPPSAPGRSRPASGATVPAPEPAAPGLLPGLGPGSPAPQPDESAEFDLDDIPF